MGDSGAPPEQQPPEQLQGGESAAAAAAASDYEAVEVYDDDSGGAADGSDALADSLGAPAAAVAPPPPPPSSVLMVAAEEGWAPVLARSPLVPALLLYLDPLQAGHPYLTQWTPTQRRALEMSALRLMAHFARPLVDLLVRSDGIAILVAYIRSHSAALSAAVPPLLVPRDNEPRDPTGPLASTDVMDRASDPLLAPPGRPPPHQAHHQHTAAGMARPRGVGAAAAATPTDATAAVSDDAGRVFAALRVLLALLRVGVSAGAAEDARAQFRTLSHAVAPADARRILAATDPAAHLGTAADVVADSTGTLPELEVAGQPLPPGVRFQEPPLPPAPREDTLGWHVAAHLGDIGFVPHVLSLLRSLDASAAAAVSAAVARKLQKTSNESAAVGGGGVRRLPQPRAGGGAPFSSTTSSSVASAALVDDMEAAATAEAAALGASATLVSEYGRQLPGGAGGRGAGGSGGKTLSLAATSYGPGLRAATNAAETVAGKEIVPPAALRELLLSVLAALCDGAAARSHALAVAQQFVVPPPVTDEPQQQQQHGGSAFDLEDDSPPPFVPEDAPIWTRLAANQDRVRAAGGIPVLLRTLRVCLDAARERTLADGVAAADQPRVATAALAAAQAIVLGNPASTARFLGSGGTEILLDIVGTSQGRGREQWVWGSTWSGVSGLSA